MKPFDLEAAKNGSKIVTRDGRNVKFVAHVPECQPNFDVIVYIEGNNTTSSFGKDGIFHGGRGEKNDLFMAPTKKTGYIHICKRIDGLMVADRNIYDHTSDIDGFITCKIEWEE